MAVGGREIGYPDGPPRLSQEHPMSVPFDPRKPAAAFDHNITLVAVLELSGKSWEMGASVPGVSRRPLRTLAVRDIGAVIKAIEQWKAEAFRAEHSVSRVVLGYEAGRDGFWIARALQERGIEVYVIHPSSIPVERRGRRAKTDRIDVDMLLRALLGWLRGEPRACTMAPIPSEAEEDMREPGREREALIVGRLKVENQIGSQLVRFGIADFNPRLKKATQKLEDLRTVDDRPLPPKTMEKLRRLMLLHRLLSEQMREIEDARQQVVSVPDPDRIERMIQLLAHIVGLGVETATVLVHEVFSRHFRDRRAIAAFVGLSGTPFDSGGSRREQGISKNGNPRVRRILTQLTWRWLKYQPDSLLSRWFHERTGGAKGRIRKIMAMALARKLLVALWRYTETGVIPEAVRLAPM
jgi:transposase